MEKELTMSTIMKKENESTLAVAISRKIEYKKHWIIDSRCLNLMTGDEEKLKKLPKYNEVCVVSINHIGETKMTSQSACRKSLSCARNEELARNKKEPISCGTINLCE